MKRREFIVLAGTGVAWMQARPVVAQQPKRLPVVALVYADTLLPAVAGADPTSPLARAIVHGLRDLRWVEGRNIVIERRSA